MGGRQWCESVKSQVHGEEAEGLGAALGFGFGVCTGVAGGACCGGQMAAVDWCGVRDVLVPRLQAWPPCAPSRGNTHQGSGAHTRSDRQHLRPVDMHTHACQAMYD